MEERGFKPRFSYLGELGNITEPRFSCIILSIFRPSHGLNSEAQKIFRSNLAKQDHFSLLSIPMNYRQDLQRPEVWGVLGPNEEEIQQ